MNSVSLSGYIASDIELKSTIQGTPVVSFSLAVKRPKSKKDITDFITVVCWKSTAEFVSKYFQKGSGIEVTGILTVRKWTDNNDNNRYSTEVVADGVDFGKRSQNQNEPPGKPETNLDIEISDDDDLPF